MRGAVQRAFLELARVAPPGPACPIAPGGGIFWRTITPGVPPQQVRCYTVLVACVCGEKYY